MSRCKFALTEDYAETMLDDADSFLRDAAGVIHVGANIGQEREIYDQLGLPVIWFEPIPKLFECLCKNIAGLPRQRAFNSLLTDRAGETYELKVSNNLGLSSSIFDLAEHKAIWPHIDYVSSVRLTSDTLASVLLRENINLEEYDALVIDTQGSELLVLKGAASVLPRFKYIKTEAADFEAYVGCCRLEEIDHYLEGYGFRERLRTEEVRHPAGGTYFDIVYQALR
jgi:FkbM family methyltransferase